MKIYNIFGAIFTKILTNCPAPIIINDSRRDACAGVAYWINQCSPAAGTASLQEHPAVGQIDPHTPRSCAVAYEEGRNTSPFPSSNKEIKNLVRQAMPGAFRHESLVQIAALGNWLSTLWECSIPRLPDDIGYRNASPPHSSSSSCATTVHPIHAHVTDVKGHPRPSPSAIRRSEGL